MRNLKTVDSSKSNLGIDSRHLKAVYLRQPNTYWAHDDRFPYVSVKSIQNRCSQNIYCHTQNIVMTELYMAESQSSPLLIFRSFARN